jgi:hypothetical protein
VQNQRENINVYYSPNIDYVLCKKWCQGFDMTAFKAEAERSGCLNITNSEACHQNNCDWINSKDLTLNSQCIPDKLATNFGINCQSGTGCYYGAGTEPFFFRPSENSVMNYSYANDAVFNKPSIEQIEKVINCCYPESTTQACKTFRSNYQTQQISDEAKIQTNMPLGEVYFRIANCTRYL